MTSGFKEHFKSEKRIKTIAFISNFFSKIFGYVFSKKTFFFIMFWGCLGLTLALFYHTLMFDNKFPIICGKIIMMEERQVNGNYGFITIQNSDIIDDFGVSEKEYKKYEELYNKNINTEYCDTYINNGFIFMIILTVISAIITLVYLIKLAEL